MLLIFFFSESVFSGLGEIEVTAVTSDCNLKTGNGNGRPYSSPHGRIRFREVHKIIPILYFILLDGCLILK